MIRPNPLIPEGLKAWPLRILPEELTKTEAKVVKPAQYATFQKGVSLYCRLLTAIATSQSTVILIRLLCGFYGGAQVYLAFV